MNFFWTKNEFDKWTKENGFDNNEDIYCLDINEAMDASLDIFATDEVVDTEKRLVV